MNWVIRKSVSLEISGLFAALALVPVPVHAAIDYGATASGYDYISSELPDGTVVAQAALLYSAGGQGSTVAAGNGVSGVGSAADAPVYSYANLATGTLFATGNWSTQYVPDPNNLWAGPTIGQASLNDTIIGFTNVSPGAIGQLVINAPIASVSGLGQISETASISSGPGGYAAGLTQTLVPTGGALTTSSTVAGACNCTTVGAWTTTVSIPFQLVAGVSYTLQESVDAQTNETNPIQLFPATGVSLGVAEIDPTWSLILPAGVSYTTSSGDSVGAAPVPVPSPWVLLLLGLPLLALVRRRDPAAGLARS